MTFYFTQILFYFNDTDLQKRFFGYILNLMRKFIIGNKIFKLRSVNYKFLIAIGILCILLIISTIQLVNQFLNYKKSSELYANVSRLALDLQDGSDYLTDEARFFVLSDEIGHLNNYFLERNIFKRRENAIEQLSVLHPDPVVIDYLQQALDESHALEEIEIYAMAMITIANHYQHSPEVPLPDEIRNVKLKPEDEMLGDEYKTAKAWLILFSEDYMAKKHQIANHKSNAILQIFDYTEATHISSYEHLKDLFVRMVIVIALVFLFNLLLFIAIITLVIRPLNKNINSIQKGSRLETTKTHEFNILTSTYNVMYDKNEANEELLRHKAEHDELTGLINRGGYNSILDVLKLQNHPVALILIDVDLFKHINDNYGHPVGDKVLQKVASTLKENFRSSDYVARIGGDEFAVILTDFGTDLENTKNLIKTKMSHTLESLKNTKGEVPEVTLSCGIEICPNGFDESLYEHADAALYEVKRSGRNGFRFF